MSRPEAAQQGKEAMSRHSACHRRVPAALPRPAPVDGPGLVDEGRVGLPRARARSGPWALGWTHE